MKKTRIIAILAAALFATAACDQKQEPAAEEPAVEKETSDEEKASEEGAAAAEKKALEKTAARTAQIGEPAPDFELKDETGKAHKLSDYKGKIVVLEWTSPECPVVQRVYKAKTMQRALKEIGADVEWLAVDSSHFVTPEDSKKWKGQNGVDWPQLQDPDGKVGQMYGAKTTPHMYVIDKKGVLRYSGAIDDDPHGKKAAEERTNYVVEAVTAVTAGEKVETTKTKPYGCSVKYDS